MALAEERERRRIATGLHDEVGQTLAIARLKLSQARNESDASALQRELDQAQDLLERSIRAIRGLSFELSSPVLYELGLEAAIEELGERVVEANGMRFELESSGPVERAPIDHLVVLHRTVRELLFNAVKHSRARSVRVELRAKGGRIRLTVEDDGVGYGQAERPPEGSKKSGYGLLSVREQLRPLGGRLEVRATGNGTRASIRLPYAP